DRAYKTYRNAVLFPEIVARLCPEYCSLACPRKDLDGAVKMNGAICPIYGVGVTCVVWLLEPLASHGLVLFFASILLCSILE
ncbi:hypothetical protein P0G10_20955, partial [Eubacteriales bacterium DFI.9.88]|nr:hypothetical protein [Eubacteriales bacterium DFI.9.88]